MLVKRKYANTPNLRIAYEELGNEKGLPVLLVHGFPDDATTWDAVAEDLASLGFRTIRPYLRGVGDSIFLNASGKDPGSTEAFSQDIVSLAKDIGLTKFVLVGHDLGADASLLTAISHQEMISGLVLLAVDFSVVNGRRPTYDQLKAYWYAWLLNSPLGEFMMREDLKAFCKYLWNIWSPSWKFSDEIFERTSHSFDNPYFIDVFLNNYRLLSSAIKFADPQKLEAEEKILPLLKIPALALHGENDCATLPASSKGVEAMFTGFFERKVLPGVGHFIQREVPSIVVKAVLEVQKQN